MVPPVVPPVEPPVGVGAGVDEGAGVGVTTGVVPEPMGDVLVPQVEETNASSSRVTEPLRASVRPSTVAPVPTETLVSARIVPAKPELVPSDAELETCQNTLQAWAPLTSDTRLPEPVVSDDGAWMTKTADGSPCASSVTVPVRPSGPAAV
ncbi:hypothetical protein CMMCAS04_03035 [Clavibacter michiganensis subsp. michiganensis]|nr:hypothetical protein CMMCAS04_03035 [Clavibacter michiganensis subsp. michiganensis]